MTNRFPDELYTLSESGGDRFVVQWVVDYFDGLLTAGKFSECDDVLRNVDAGRLSTPILVSIFGITLAAKDKLPARVRLFEDALAAVEKERGSEGAGKLLEKYE